MKDSDPALERLRIALGLLLIVVCGTILWRKQLKPDLEKGKLNVWEARAQVSDNMQQWLRQSRAEERLKKRKEEFEKEAREGATEKTGAGSDAEPKP